MIQNINARIVKKHSKNIEIMINSCTVNCYKQHKEKCIKINTKDSESNIEIKPLNLNEYEDVILSQNELIKLKQNEIIMTMLRNRKLKRIIKVIDQAQYKKKSLERMQFDPEFNDFCAEILTTLGFVRDHFFTLHK